MESYDKRIFAENLKRYMDKNGKEPRDICELLHVQKSTVSSWLNAKKCPRMDKIETLASYFGIMKSDLLEKKKSGIVVPFYETYKDAVIFPVVASICAGYNGMAQEEYSDDIEAIPRSMFKGYDPEEMRVFRVSGNSMYPRFLNGDRVLVHIQSDVENGDVAVVWYDCEEVTLKVVNHIPGGVELVPYNPEYQKKRITGPDAEQVHIFGKVLKLIRDV